MKIFLIIIGSILVIPLFVFVIVLAAIVSIPLMFYKIFELYFAYRERRLTILTDKELNKRTMPGKTYYSLFDNETE